MTDPTPLDILGEALAREVAGQFDIERPIGRGGHASVFLARDLALQRHIAIKVIPRSGGDPTAVERLLREARYSAAFDHPHIVSVHAVRSTETLAYIVMQYVEGVSLEALIKSEGPLSAERVQALALQVADALAYAHERGVVHRDVKPANILVDYGSDGRERALVTDFGIATTADADTLTATGFLVGTPMYMSPEQFNGADATAASDQYALGITLYQLLTGEAPFTGGSIGELVRGHLLSDLPSPRLRMPECPESLARVVLRMAEKRSESRFPSMNAVSAALRGEHPPTLARAPRVEGLGRRTAVVAAATATVVSLAVGAWYLAGQSVTDATTPTTTTTTTSSLPAVDSVASPSVVGTADANRDALSSGTSDRGPSSSRPSAPEGATQGPRGAAIIDPNASPAPAGSVGIPPVDPSIRAVPGPVDSSTPIRDSAAPSASGSQPRVESGDATVLLGSRAADAVFYIDGKAMGRIGTLRPVRLPASRNVTLRVASECDRWDTTMVLLPESELRIGYRARPCS